MCGDPADDPSMHDIEEDIPEPPDINDIAIDNGLKPASLKLALRQAHPQASVTEVIWAAHQIEEGAQ